MKWLIYILILFNLGFFAWNYQAAPWRHDAAPASTGPGEDVARLRLLSEPAGADQGHSKPPAHSASAPSAAQCPTLGPFDKRAQAASAAKRLRDTDLHGRVRVEHLSDEKGYWVLIPPSKSRSAARKTIAKLRAQGVKDYFLVATGDMKNAISLGVYSSRGAARQRMDDMRELDLSPELQDVPLPQRRYWVDLPSNTPADDVQAALKALLADYPHLQRKRHACEGG